MPFERMPIADENEELEKQLDNMKPMGLADPFFDTRPSSVARVVEKRGPRGSVYTERVATYLTKDMAAELAAYCKANGVTPATAGRLAFRLLLESEDSSDSR